jgi:hypothetical protein
MRASAGWAVSSAVEHCLHTAGVTGSKPVPPTKNCQGQRDAVAFSIWRLPSCGSAICKSIASATTGIGTPHGEDGELLVAVNRQWLIAQGVEQKLLPGSDIRQYTQARPGQLEAKQGFKPGRAQARDMREQVTAELMPLMADLVSALDGEAE